MSESSQITANKLLNLNSSEDTFKRDTVEGTPFDIITTSAGSSIALGLNILTEPIQDIEEVRKKIIEKDWILIASFIITILKINNKNIENENNNR